MDLLLKQKKQELVESQEYECWYLVKQPTDFGSICYLVDILDSYKKNNETDNIQSYIEKNVAKINSERNLEISSNYRALRVAAFLGLIKMNSSAYGDCTITDVFYRIKEFCNGFFEKKELYSNIIQQQIEKMFVSSSIDEEFLGVRKLFRLYPVMLLYKILIELGYTNGNYSISLDEYRYLVTTTKRYEHFLQTLLLITKWREMSEPEKNEFSVFRTKFDNRFIQVLKQLDTLEVDKERISLKNVYIKKVAKKIYYFEYYLKDKSFNDSACIDLLCSYNPLISIDDDIDNHSTLKFPPRQTIYYGVPGCGKSYTVKEKLKKHKIDSENVVRVVFHPDYSNADFVGQIYPSITGEYKTVYKFKAGPFSKILKMAYLNPTKSYCLVIEEINRGNAAAIFGDLFQLLDRIEKKDDFVKEGEDEGCGNRYELGWSCYGVDNEAINGYIRSLENKKNLPNVKSREFNNGVPEICFESLDIYYDSAANQNGVKPLVHFNANTAIRLPPNLSILATMNTSDQNVFTLDNAFQRRWKMEYIQNVLDEDSEQYNLEIGETKVKWGDFHKAINELIKEKSQSFGGYASAEDKCLGGYFITAKNENSNPSKETKDSEATSNDTKKEAYIDGKEFAEKVLKFLWDDAFKMSREGVFKTEVKSFSDLLTAFNEGNSEKAFENVFVSEFANKLNLTLRHSPHDP